MAFLQRCSAVLAVSLIQTHLLCHGGRQLPGDTEIGQFDISVSREEDVGG